MISNSLSSLGMPSFPSLVTHLPVRTRGPSGDKSLPEGRVLTVGLQALCWATGSFCWVRLRHPALPGT